MKKKTRVLITNGIQYLPNVDDIIVLKEGEISERGTYKELLAKNGAFAEFLRQHLETADDDIDELEDATLLQDLQGVVGDIEKIRKKRRVSGSESEAGLSESSPRRRPLLGRTISEIERRSSAAESLKSSRGSQVGGSKLIEKEKSETESVKLTVYLDYFRSGGWMYFIGTVALYFICQAFSVGSNLFLSSWTSRLDLAINAAKMRNISDLNGTNVEVDTGAGSKEIFLGVYGGLGVGQAFAILAGSFVMALGTLKSASNLHMQMLQRILRAPLSFFDVTPSGRVLNRFAKDVDICGKFIGFTSISYNLSGREL